MTYKLAFTKTKDGLLRVTVSKSGLSERAVAIYEDDHSFLQLAKHSNIEPGALTQLEQAVQTAFSSRNTPACCDELDLTEDQLSFLRLGMASKLIA